MPTAKANGIQIEYDTFGKKSSRPLLLIMGLSAQMIFWDEQFCKQLADKGHYVIRFDNRDVGLSSKLDNLGVPDVMRAISARMQGEKFKPPYTIRDMADDSFGLLDALHIDNAHVCGVSMGGMIAQTMAIQHPDRVRSLTSIMSTPGDPNLPQGKPEVMAVLLAPPPVGREAAIEHGIKIWRTISGPGFPFDETWTRKTMSLSYDRAYCPQGVMRQLVAIMAQEDRTPALRKIAAPTLVIHGADDPLVPVVCGKATAAAVPGSSLLIIPGMGHSLPTGAWPQIIDAISKHTQKAED
jgi:pimeloyl-ACP methyl ester carboxylesterase